MGYELTQKIVNANSETEMGEALALFNREALKSSMIRHQKLEVARDEIAEQIIKRVTTCGDEFSNADLIKYYEVLTKADQKLEQAQENITVPKIAVQNNTYVQLTADQHDNVRDYIEKVLRGEIANEQN